MKIRLWSDLHLEFTDNKFDHLWQPAEEDKEQTLILSGDIAKGMGARHFVEELCKHFKYVLMTCGNHEFYDNDFYKVIEDWRAYSNGGSILIDKGPDNFHFLYNESAILDGVRFIGGTMWTDYNGADPICMGAAHRIMTDFGVIRCEGQYITPHFIIREHDKFMDFLLQKFDEPFDGPTVVMSHHSPGNELKRRGRLGDRVGPAYFADIEEVIGHHNKAKVWTHGHTHRNWDYMINETRVLCNPYGYFGHATNGQFDPKFTFEV
jgi:predicted phosphodiesterase